MLQEEKEQALNKELKLIQIRHDDLNKTLIELKESMEEREADEERGFRVIEEELEKVSIAATQTIIEIQTHGKQDGNFSLLYDMLVSIEEKVHLLIMNARIELAEIEDPAYELTRHFTQLEYTSELIGNHMTRIEKLLVGEKELSHVLKLSERLNLLALNMKIESTRNRFNEKKVAVFTEEMKKISQNLHQLAQK